ncbi:MAG: FAD-binding oxidoreductase [Fimbriimonadaceae bacterium]|nr:FAD-binding oxidoreductase [Fimbriimonadaceae bacterium]
MSVVADLRDAVLSHGQVRVVGTGSRLEWCTPWDGPTVSTRGLVGIEELSVADRLVTVRAGTLVVDLVEELASHGLGLPLAQGEDVVTQRYGTVGGLLMGGLPAWGTETRDWVLGMQVMRGDGSLCRVGAKVAKSVAGYDGHRFLVGSRGGLAVCVSVSLRLWPASLVEGLQAPQYGEVRAVWSDGQVAWGAAPPPGAEWWVGRGGSRSPSVVPDLERRAKSILDPDGRFVEGWQA